MRQPSCSGSARTRCAAGSGATAFPARSLARRPPPVRARRDRGAAADARRDAQRLLRDLARPRARRGTVLSLAAGRGIRRVRRGAGANRLLEESLTLRSFERTIEEILLAAVATHTATGPHDGRVRVRLAYATGWLSALKRLAPPASRPEGILIFDASAPCDLDALHAQALELVLRRAGLRTLLLTPADRARPPRPRAPGARPERRRAHRPPRLARLDRPACLRGPQRRPGGRRVRLPRRGPRHRRQHGLPPRRDADRRPRSADQATGRGRSARDACAAAAPAAAIAPLRRSA